MINADVILLPQLLHIYQYRSAIYHWSYLTVSLVNNFRNNVINKTYFIM